jgi:hypothetical protein
MQKYIELTGKIIFDPIDFTKKHKKQSSWKRLALVMLDGDICEYYAWFINKRYNLELNRPLRGPHISFINDSLRDMSEGLNISENNVQNIWNKVKDKWNNKSITIYLNPDVRSNTEHWWLNIPEEKRTQLYNIRKELGLDKPYYGLHMSIGYANSRNIEHSKYITRIVTKLKNEYN